ncbi:MAG: FAD-dependent monooxygenase [Actinomycetota bacterium]|nr:FAD-dependent monooxygenase [Actinomycetota bacterium]
MSVNRTALVIGGGIAGPASAMALQKAGIEATVYEAYPTPADGVGAFLTLASNGIDALRVLGADEPVLEAGFPTPRITLRSGTGKRLGVSPLGETLADGTTSQTLKRADLYQALHDQALSRGIGLEFGKRLVMAEESGHGVRATFADGSVATADVLIGCDGLHSTVRRILDRHARGPRYAGLVGTGGYARGVALDSAPGEYEMIFGKRAFFGYVVAAGDEVWWFANVPQAKDGPVREVAGAQLRKRLLALFAEDAGPAVELIEASADVMPMTPFHWMPPLRTWHGGRIVVIGDAAHAPTPTSGQGASLAIEDAVVLAKCLRDMPEAPTAFARFEALRRPRVERIVRWAVRLNRSKASGPVGRVVRDAVLPTLLRITANSKAAREPFDYHIEWDETWAAA